MTSSINEYNIHVERTKLLSLLFMRDLESLYGKYRVVVLCLLQCTYVRSV
jgi:hypothetical protein